MSITTIDRSIERLEDLSAKSLLHQEFRVSPQGWWPAVSCDASCRQFSSPEVGSRSLKKRVTGVGRDVTVMY